MSGVLYRLSKDSRQNACRLATKNYQIISANYLIFGNSVQAHIDGSPKDDVLPTALEDVSSKRKFFEMLFGRVVDKFIL